MPEKEPSEQIAARGQPRPGCRDLVGEVVDLEEIGYEGLVAGSSSSSGDALKKEVLSPSYFLKSAESVVHPYDQHVKVERARVGANQLKENRKTTLQWYEGRARDLEEKELAIHNVLDDGVRKVVEPRGIILFNEMLKEICYDDIGAADLLVTGVKLVGTLGKIGMAAGRHRGQTVDQKRPP